MKFWGIDENRKLIGIWILNENCCLSLSLCMSISPFRKKLGFILHVVFFVVMISSIFWLRWYWVLLIFTLLRIQDFIFGGCILTRLEFWDLKRQWVKYHYVKMNKLPTKYFALCIDWLYPLTLVILAYFIQR